MKSICNLIFAALLFAMVFAVTELKAEDSQESKIGLTVGIDYVSNYIYRGQYFYEGTGGLISGMFSPYASYNIFNTGLSIGIKGEISEAWFWDKKDELKNFKQYNSIDYNINYMYEFKESITFNVGGWYYAYQKKDFHLPQSGSVNTSYFDIYFSASVDALPLAPRLIVTYSYFIDEDYARGVAVGNLVWGKGPGKNGDLYVQFGLGHSFELFNKTYFDLEATAGFYDENSIGYKSILQSPDVPSQTKSTDISDIDLSAGITTTAGILTLFTSFHYVIVPGTQYKHSMALASHGGYAVTFVKDIHRFYAKFGVSCSI